MNGYFKLETYMQKSVLNHVLSLLKPVLVYLKRKPEITEICMCVCVSVICAKKLGAVFARFSDLVEMFQIAYLKPVAIPVHMSYSNTYMRGFCAE
jgi:hypothetical protein